MQMLEEIKQTSNRRQPQLSFTHNYEIKIRQMNVIKFGWFLLQLMINHSEIILQKNKSQLRVLQHKNFFHRVRILLDNLLVAINQEIPQFFAERRCSVPCWQQPATDSDPEPMNPLHALNPFSFNIHFNIILPSMLSSSIKQNPV